MISSVTSVDALEEKNQHYFTLIDVQMTMTEATNHSYVDDMLDGRREIPEVRFQQAAVTERCRGVRVRK